jgi:hypothetical protein
MKTTRSWVPLLLSVITLAVHGAPEATGQGFSNWSTPVNLGPTINSSAFEGCHFVTEAGLSLYFASDRPGGLGDRDIYVSRRAGINDPWGPPQNLGATINTVSDDRCPFVTPDGHTMIFASARSGGQGMGDLYVSFRRNPLDNLAWETPQNLTELNTASDEFGPSAFVHPQTGGSFSFSIPPGRAAWEDKTSIRALCEPTAGFRRRRWSPS